MNKKARELDTWERGEASPTYIQLEKLAYKIYKRPIALFFFPEVPEEEIIEQEFRTLPEDALLSIPPWMRYLLRKAKSTTTQPRRTIWRCESGKTQDTARS